MFLQHSIDNKPVANSSDPEYDKEESELERYYDPDFEDEWNNTDLGEESSNIVGENPLSPEGKGEMLSPSNVSEDLDINNLELWEEVE